MRRYHNAAATLNDSSTTNDAGEVVDIYGEPIPPGVGPWQSIEEIRNAQGEAGGRLWSPESLKLYGSRFLGEVIGGRFFVTSERTTFWGRRYTINAARDNGEVSLVGEFGAWATARDARREAERLARILLLAAPEVTS